MISQINSSVANSAYAAKKLDIKGIQNTQKGEGLKQGDTSKIEQIKDALASGEYKINLEALSKKIAQELL